MLHNYFIFFSYSFTSITCRPVSNVFTQYNYLALERIFPCQFLFTMKLIEMEFGIVGF